MYTQTETEKEEEEKPNMSLICNIPEHHSLEDLVHNYQQQLENLKAYVQEMDNETSSAASSTEANLALMEKRAEFEALDLAINQRKQQLVNLEMSKNRRINEMMQHSGGEETISEETMNSENEIILRVWD